MAATTDMEALSVYFGDGNHKGRRAHVMWCPDKKGYFVEMMNAA